jgi:ACS family tartrate transporter-like MFS transporter
MSLSNPSGAVSPAQSSAALTESEQRETLRRISLRLIPLLFLCYVIAYIDRINVGFAKLQLQDALGVPPDKFASAYGFGAGIFFFGYFLFEVPSNLAMVRVGARIWIARIMILWGIVSAAFMFLKGATMFYVLRFLLGAAEAGFFPGVLLYFTYWFPARERAKMIALFSIGGVAAGVVGSPINGTILQHMDSVAGLKGWQWLFLLEGIPAVLIGLVVLKILPNGPQDSSWLNSREKAWIANRLANDPDAQAGAERHSLKHAFTSPIVYLFCAIYLTMNIGAYGFEMWAPSIITQLSGGSAEMVGWLNAIPYFTAGVMMFVIGHNSDRTGERRLHIAACAFVATIGFAIAANSKNPVWGMVGLVIAFTGVKCTIAPFWAMSSAFLRGTAAAGGLAFINSVGNLGGYYGPRWVGLLKDKYHGSNFAPLLLLGGSLLVMALLTIALQPAPRRVPDR